MTMFPDRVLDKIDFTPTCWLWTAYRNGDGYGIVRWQGRVVGVHRLFYQELVALVPEGLELDHLCGNRACVNPDHLEPVTHAENVRRGNRPNKTHCRNGHPWVPENIRVSRRGRKDTRIRRDCLTCYQAQRQRAAEVRWATKVQPAGTVSAATYTQE